MKPEKISSNYIKQLAIELKIISKQASSKDEALLAIATYIKSQIGEFIRPEILLAPNEISIHFMELLDQILFEINEPIPTDNSIKTYLINDLYLRLTIYLDLYDNLDTYKKNLTNRILTFEDTIIIKNYHLNEYTNILIAEFYDQPSLQKWILRALLSLDSEDLLQFYYMICTEKNCLEVKLLALAGLKSFHDLFANWDTLAPDIDLSEPLISYIRSFDSDNLAVNPQPEDIKALIFVLIYIEHNIDKIPSIEWFVTLLKPLTTSPVENSLSVSIYISITHIFLNINPELLSSLSKDDELMRSFLQIIDSMPRDYFDKISLKFSKLENNFISAAKSLINSNQVHTDEYNSNLISFFLAGKITI